MANLVKMTREDGKAADVHPDMIEDYKRGGYVVSDAEKPTAKRGRPSKKAD